MAIALRDAGYTVVEARSGALALAHAGERREPIHLMITDLVMPGMSGRELVERWRVLHPETRALFMSGYTDATAHHGGLPAGAAFIQKSFAPSALARRVRDVLERPDPQ